MPRILDILIDELSAVTPAMLEAGSRAEAELRLVRDSEGRWHLRAGVTDDMRLKAIWGAMLLAKLTGGG